MNRLNAPWLSLPSLQKLFHVIEEAGGDLRLVGGAVRDGLLGVSVEDIDLAVDRDPVWVSEVLEAQGIKVVPTGIAHGTVTAIAQDHVYQITTLRLDVKTFGRRAEVAFTQDWVQDAQRRDFTINAIYADKEGTLFDPVGGLEDLQFHRVRFIGDPAQRIQEDYLRILRFFRFSARFGQGQFDAPGLEGCRAYAPQISSLAKERITEEFLKLLALPSPLPALQLMEETGVLATFLPVHSWELLFSLFRLEEKLSYSPDPIMRLAALSRNFSGLRLSKTQEDLIFFLQSSHSSVTEKSFKKDAYVWGKERTLKLALFQAAQEIAMQKREEGEALAFLRAFFAFSWEPPEFPLKGADVLEQGEAAGPQVGHHLKQVQQWWLEQDLEPGREVCLAYLSKLLKSE